MKTKLQLILFFNIVILSLSAQNNLQRLDSVVVKSYNSNDNTYYLSDMHLFSYDTNQKNILSQYAQWNTNSSVLVPNYKTEYTHGAHGLTSLTQYTYNSNTMQLQPYEKTLYTYNSNGRLLEKVEQVFDINTASFVNQDKEIYVYAMAGDPYPTEVQIWSWDNVGNTWLYTQKATITFNANWDFTEILLEVYDMTGNVWQPQMKWSRTYDNNNRVLQQLVQQWSANQWDNTQKINFVYTATASIEQIEVTIQSWNSGVWTNSSQTIYKKDLNSGELSEAAYLYWNASLSAWSGNSKNTYQRNGNQVTVTNIGWDQASQIWMTDGINKEVYEYDLNFVKNDLNLPVEMQNNRELVEQIFDFHTPYFNVFANKLLFVTNYSRNSINDTWAETYKSSYKYSSSVNDLNDLANDKISFFPNPFQTVVNINVKTNSTGLEVFITDLQDRIVYKATHYNNTTIDLSMLPNGVYIYHVKTDRNNFAGKIIKK